MTTRLHTWNPGDTLYSADLNGNMTGLASDIAAAAAAASAAAAAAAAAVQPSQLGSQVATLVNGLVPASQLPSAGVTSFAGRTGAVTPVAADYQLACDISLPKPSLSAFPVTLKSSSYPPAVASVQDAGDCLVISQLSNSGVPNYAQKTVFGVFHAVGTTNTVTACVEPDVLFASLATTPVTGGVPDVCIGLLTNVSGTPSQKFSGLGGVIRSSQSSIAALSLAAPLTYGYNSNSTTAADIAVSSGTNLSTYIPITRRIWLRATGLQSGSVTCSVSYDGRVWYPNGSLTVAASTIAAVGFATSYAATGTTVVGAAKIIGWQES